MVFVARVDLMLSRTLCTDVPFYIPIIIYSISPIISPIIVDIQNEFFYN
jgi:hypothetical protein